jgi:hypothetical protein
MEVNIMGFGLFGRRGFGDRFDGFGCGGFGGGFGGGCGGGCGGGWGGWDGCRDRVKTKFFNIRGCVVERGGRDWDC